MKTILGTLRKESGTIIAQETIDQDVNLERYKRCFSYLPEEPLLFTELTVMQHFQLYGLSYRVGETTFNERLERYIDGFQLSANLSSYPEQLVYLVPITLRSIFLQFGDCSIRQLD